MPKLAFVKNPVAALLPAAPGWNAPAVEMLPDGTPVWQDAAKTRARVLFMPITAWGLTIPVAATEPPSVSTVLSAIFSPAFGPLREGLSLIPIAADVRVQDEPGFRLLCPPGETFEQAIARAEAACAPAGSPP